MRILVLMTCFFGLGVFAYGQSADSLSVLDTRSTNELPAFYSKEFKVEFKERTTIGAPGVGTYSGLFTLAPWGNSSNSGGYNYQLNFNEGGIYYRKALPLDASWGSWTQLITANSSGNVGIGTTSPTSKLHLIDGTTELRMGSYGYDVDINATGGWARNYSFSSNGNVRAHMGARGTGNVLKYLYFDSNNESDPTGHSTPEMVIMRNGNVGIGTITPTKKLEILSYDSWNNPPLRIGSTTSEPAVDFRSGTAAFSIAVNDGANNAFKIYHQAPDNSLVVSSNGNIGIGTLSPGTYKLAVEGKIGARSVKVTTANWADYVFAPSYVLMSLPETEAYINKNQHLPNIPSAAEVKANGFNLEEMDANLLAKIEELTLHLIAQEKALAAQQVQIQALQKELARQTQ
jgi:hypothetical protein